MKSFAAFLVFLLAPAAFGADADKAALIDEADGRNWPGYGRTYNETHFSPLAEINRDTVGRLHLAWTFELPKHPAQSTPIAVDGVIYVAAGYSVVYAIDAKSGKQLWRYDPETFLAVNQKLRGGAGVHGLAYSKGRVFIGTHDGRLIALDAKKGTVAWTATTLDATDRSFISGAPRVCGDQVVIGFGMGAGDALRGLVSAYDATSGKQSWRWYAVPEGKGGGTVWNAITCDPAANRVYVGTAEPRGGADAASFVSSVVALDAHSGALAWTHKADAGGTALDASLDLTLATLYAEGKSWRVLLQAPKDGYSYVIDRDSGKRLSVKKIDTGAHTPFAQAFSPKTGLVYLPTAQPDGTSSLTAWNPVKQLPMWSVPNAGPFGGGALATAGDLVFQGQMDGYVNGYDASSGRKVWSFYAATAALGAPISFAVGTQQYVAILAGPPAGAAANLGAPSAKFGWDSRLHPRRLLVFTLDASASLPATPGPTPAKALDGPELAVDETLAKQGAELWRNCSWCHGANAIAGGMAPDLRASPLPLNAAQFKTVVNGGLETKGMPKFAELSERDLEALRHFIRKSAQLETRPNGVAPPPPEAPPPPVEAEKPVEPPKPAGSLESESQPPPQ